MTSDGGIGRVEARIDLLRLLERAAPSVRDTRLLRDHHIGGDTLAQVGGSSRPPISPERARQRIQTIFSRMRWIAERDGWDDAEIAESDYWRNERREGRPVW
jgi:hypothetical protein